MPNRSAGPIKGGSGAPNVIRGARAAEIAGEKSNLKLKWGEFVSPLLSYDDSSRVGNETQPGAFEHRARRVYVSIRF